ncbi:acyclic terpene utilization AtuA family protein [Cribrihabitans neustonicus]|uniref:acyclic terpene utilization AtuA family protein n=1 Tax=Cribrihabitans neustonicus TaxID=1429085 RepID=UPI003B5CE955
MTRNTLRIGGACGFWGEASHATTQLLTDPALDVLVYDYLAEITLSILARARAKDPATGYAADFVRDAMAPNLAAIADRGVRVLSNAGGMNPQACADALRAEIERQGLSLKVAVVEGDDLRGRIETVAEAPDMFSGAAYPPRDKVLSVNAYLGAGPMAAALEAGAGIVITGRCADSALTLAACMHAFGWQADQLDLMAAGSLAGHLLECGPQATGGNFTDWEFVPGLATIGYPVAEMRADGVFTIEKPEGTGGLVTREAVGEQLLYEIGDPQAYLLPDVICDFSGVTLREVGPGRVEVSGARGRAPSGKLKVSTTWHDGFRAGQVLNFNGRGARAKGGAYAQAVLDRVAAKLSALNAPGFDKVSIECFGGRTGEGDYEEVAMTAAVQHQDAAAVALFLKELIGAALATPPGLHFFTGAGRPKPSPVVALHSSLVPADLPEVTVTLDGAPVPFEAKSAAASDRHPPAPEPPVADATGKEMVTVLLEDLAVARSGDKGDAANVGVMARVPVYLPWIWAALTPGAVAAHFKGLAEGAVQRFYLPGTAAMNILMHNALDGGGIASLRNDSQGKGFAQRLLSLPVAVPAGLVSNPSRRAG